MLHNSSLNSAAQRPASPAAHTTHQARRLAHESRAIRGRVHAVVMLELIVPPRRTPRTSWQHEIADMECLPLSSWVDSTDDGIQSPLDYPPMPRIVQLRGAGKQPSINVKRRHNARHQPPRTQPRNHSSLADESNAIRGRVHAVVRCGVSIRFKVAYGRRCASPTGIYM